ncbi:MAG: LPS export ABC transporter periplasmic protein LptC [marine benthic group bacterium]|nr:LPS export ABC transporter periplasmic protein LptC [Gemmatimonadota bacterium]MCL7957138.1 LPS export ABC transporter periplasmic protein LptC [Gemmatimonadota bacterium]MCL7961725.1 LPS export ABC transporter periplasmic protein LptC [Candidatus Carthagonibacter metallireducens]MCL7982387.1 LPS export ABC transporter periplasmic protein LptC [Gemmatimonadota bacterium]MCL7985001.1 LPS export ABC transporter periplasmic protein LptC [Gemmatimonadota bacterium]
MSRRAPVVRPPGLELASVLVVLMLAGCDEKEPVLAGEAPSVFVEGADQVMVGVENHITRQGVRQAELEADTAYTFEDAGRLDLKQVTLTFFGEAGDTVGVLTGQSAEYQLEAGDVTVRGDVEVDLRTGERFEAPVLAYISASNQIRADSGYVLIYPDGTVDRGTYVVRDLSTDETRYGEGRTTTPEVTVPQ